VTDTQEDPLGPAAEPDGAPRTLDAARFRQALGHFATGVTIITASGGDGPVGLAVNSFTSVSLDPPLVAFCAAHSSSTWPHIHAAGHFCVNVMAEDQEDVCRLFATKGADRFGSVGWRKAETGAPILDGVLAWIDCEIDAEHDAGDHTIVVGRVIGLDTETERKPLVFFRGGYGRYDA
jgi:flavin reductase (DIM6/NTAB) family NADH-FMN oxidoreductase RutF